MLDFIYIYIKSNQIKTSSNSQLKINAGIGDGFKLPKLITSRSAAADFIKGKKKPGVSQRDNDSRAWCCRLLLLDEHRCVQPTRVLQRRRFGASSLG